MVSKQKQMELHGSCCTLWGSASLASLLTLLGDPVPSAGLTVDRVLAGLAIPAAVVLSCVLCALIAVNVIGGLLADVAPALNSIAAAITPIAVRRCLLGICGIAVSTSAAAGSAAADTNPPSVPALSPGRVAGLPLPDLPTAPALTVVVVHRGDSLWSIADRTLPGSSSEAAVAHRVTRLYAENRRTIGPDPNLIYPGQPLLVPGGLS